MSARPLAAVAASSPAMIAAHSRVGPGLAMTARTLVTVALKMSASGSSSMGAETITRTKVT